MKQKKGIGVKLMEGRKRGPLPEELYKQDTYETPKVKLPNISEEGQHMDEDDDDEMSENQIINKKTGSLFDKNMDIVKAKERIEKDKAKPISEEAEPKAIKMSKKYIAKLKKVKI
jgi:hypothetical protein